MELIRLENEPGQKCIDISTSKVIYIDTARRWGDVVTRYRMCQTAMHIQKIESSFHSI